MAVEIKVPSVGESITEVTLVKWIKNDGEWEHYTHKDKGHWLVKYTQVADKSVAF